MPIVLPPPVTSADEQLSLDGLDLNVRDGAYQLLSVAFPPPEKRLEWSTSVDADGGVLVRDPLVDNRTITATIEVEGADRDQAHVLIGDLVAKLEECELQDDGLPLVWTPTDSSTSLTFYCLTGQVTEIPMEAGSTYFNDAPAISLNVTLTCKPFGYGDEVLLGTATASTPLVTVAFVGPDGDIPAEGRLVVTDSASQARRDVMWGLESRHYDSGTSLLIDSASLVTAGYSGTATTRTGAYSASGVIRKTIVVSPSTICATPVLSHVGAFRVFARVYAALTTDQVRLSWQVGDGSFTSNAWATAAATGFAEVDLGTVLIPPAARGTQRWVGRVETQGTWESTIDIDYLTLVPIDEGFGRAQASLAADVPAVSGYDSFTLTTAGGTLNGRTAPAGGTWATTSPLGSGADWVFTDNPEALSRNPTSGDRNAVIGSASTDQYMGLSFKTGSTLVGYTKLGPLLRHVDNSNNAFVAFYGQNALPTTLSLTVTVGGVVTATYSVPVGITYQTSTWYKIQGTVWASGTFVVDLLGISGGLIKRLVGRDPALATGGALASGKVGFRDASVIDTTYYDDVSWGTPGPEPIALASGRTLEFGADDVLRQDSTGTYYGRPPSYRGNDFLIPPAGDAVRSSRIAVRAARFNLDEASHDYIADSTTVSAYATPRFLVVPR